MTDTDKLPLNEAGTHVLTVAPSGVPWECPLGYLETAKSHGYKVVGDEADDVPKTDVGEKADDVPKPPELAKPSKAAGSSTTIPTA